MNKIRRKSTKAQEENLHLNREISNLHFCSKKKSTKAQEEMVGFGLILILVGIIFIVFISIYIRKPSEKIQDYEVNSFLQSVLQYTTICKENGQENLTIQELMAQCKERNPCDYREMDPCSILNNTVRNILQESWKVSSTTPTRGYSFNMNISEDGQIEKQFLNIKQGVVTNNYREGEQDLPPKRGDWEYAVILFRVYN